MTVWPGGSNTKTIPQQIQEAIEPLQKRIEELEKRLRKPIDPRKVAIADILKHDELGLVSYQPNDSPIPDLLRVRDIRGYHFLIPTEELYPLDSPDEVEQYWKAHEERKQRGK